MEGSLTKKEYLHIWLVSFSFSFLTIDHDQFEAFGFNFFIYLPHIYFFLQVCKMEKLKCMHTN